MTGRPMGKPISRVDGPKKVRGEAKYAAEQGENVAHACVVSSPIARGRIQRIDTRRALAVPGVLYVLTHENRPALPWFDRSFRDDDAPPGSPFRPLFDAEVIYSGQPLAVVIADTLEVARYAAGLVDIEYVVQAPTADLRRELGNARPPRGKKLGYEGVPKAEGDADRALRQAPVAIDVEYECPAQHHNPIEMHASTVIVEADGKLTIYDKTQGALNSQAYVMRVFGLTKDEVRVVSPFVGGAFGSGLRPQYQLFLAVMAARVLGRSVRLELSRPQMFTFGHRPATVQRVALGAERDGKLTAMVHEAIAETSRFEDYAENVVSWSPVLYPCTATRFAHRLVELDVYTPLDMRAPGAATGVFAIECAMDELAVALGMDPLALRLRNYAERDEVKDKPFSSKELRACYAVGAQAFGWEHRAAAPRTLRDGNELVGWGMATGVWDAMQAYASARARLTADGRLTVSSATADIGTGTYTVMSQIAADTLGVRVEDVTFLLGDSSLPKAPFEGGSMTVATVGTAVKKACEGLRRKLLGRARERRDSPFAGLEEADVSFANGALAPLREPRQKLSYVELLRQGGDSFLEEEVTALPNVPKQMGYTRHTHAAVFAEVKVDEALGTVRVTRVVSAVAGGKIVNPKTARSQILGSIVGGIGMALHEASVLDPKRGRFMTHDLAEYHIPVNADVPDLQVFFVPEEDSIVNPLGVKGLGEIGIVGVAAAIANAVFHATGRRVRSLPITLDKLL
jgi:xanthine dehydrogenase YagR molybdenum-binding subunit